MSAVSNKCLAMLTVDTISSLCNDESFNALHDTCLKEAEKIPTIGAPFLKRNRKYPNKKNPNKKYPYRKYPNKRGTQVLSNQFAE